MRQRVRYAEPVHRNASITRLIAGWLRFLISRGQGEEAIGNEVLISHHILRPGFSLECIFRTNLLERSDPRFRSGQTRERIPSNAWARKIAAPTKPITAVIVSNIANIPLRNCATENGGQLAQSKRFPGTNTQSRSTEDFAQQTCIVVFVIPCQNFEISRHAA
jgi:hypothetical protein